MEDLESTPSSVQPRPANCRVPLTATQLEAWNSINWRGTPLSDMRIAAASVRISGPLDTSALQMCIDLVVQRHESLRTRVSLLNGTAEQHIYTDGQYSLETIDLTNLKNAESEAKRFAQEFIDERVDLTVGPLFVSRLLKVSSQESILILAIDHLVSDALSCKLLSDDLWTLYGQVTRQRSRSLPNLDVQFADYAVWQEKTYQDWCRKHEWYWRERLAHAPSIEIPRNTKLGESRSPESVVQHFPLGSSLTNELRTIACREGTQLAVLFLSIYVAATARWCDTQDVVLRFVSHGRQGRPELKNMIGFLATHLYLRVQLAKSDCFLDLIKKADLELRSAREHNDYGRVPNIISDCNTELNFNWMTSNPNGSRSSLIESLGDYAKLEIKPFPIKKSWQPALLSTFYETPSGVCATFAHRPDLISEISVRRFGDNLRSFASDFAKNPRASPSL